MPSDVPAVVIIGRQDAVRPVRVEYGQTERHPDEKHVEAPFRKQPKEWRVGGLLHLAAGIEDQSVFGAGTVEKPPEAGFRYGGGFIGYKRLRRGRIRPVIDPGIEEERRGGQE